ncbi:MAG: hypothetical protein JWP87_459 [Labilithrix sp.]|nr:hypothetical protein [Labilithrix sp.]
MTMSSASPYRVAGGRSVDVDLAVAALPASDGEVELSGVACAVHEDDPFVPLEDRRSELEALRVAGALLANGLRRFSPRSRS